jgi:hypothetical protein
MIGHHCERAAGTGRRNTIDHWARRGIAGRAVFIDIDRALGGAGHGFEPVSARALK